MAYRYVQLGVGLLSVASPASALAHPKPHPHAMAHPQNYNDMSMYKGVDFEKAYYEGTQQNHPPPQQYGNPSQPQPQQNAPPTEHQAPAPKPKAPTYKAPAPAPKPEAPAPKPKAPSYQPKPEQPAPKSPSKGSDTPSGSKAGLAYNQADLCHGFQGASWAYNWVSQPGGSIPKDLEFVPTLHDMTSQFTSVFAKEAAAQNPKHVMSFNEPDMPSQANIPAEQCASDYKNTFESAAPKGARLGAPSVTSSLEPGKGLSYLDTFMKACKGCKIDFICLHYYGQPNQWSYFTNYIQNAKKFGKPIWVTEYGLTSGGTEAQAKFIKDATEYLQKEPMVERYSPYMVGQGDMFMTADNPVGKAYMSAI